MTNKWIFEVIHDDWPEWSGNQLYDTMEYAKFCAEQDFFNNFVTEDSVSWEILMKGIVVLYINKPEGMEPSGIEIRVRHVNSLKEK